MANKKYNIDISVNGQTDINKLKQSLQATASSVNELESKRSAIEAAFKSVAFGTKEYGLLAKELQRVNSQLANIEESVTDITSAEKVEGFVRFGSAIAGIGASVSALSVAFGGANEEVDNAIQKIGALLTVMEALQLVTEALGKENKFFTQFLANVTNLGQARDAATTATLANAAANLAEAGSEAASASATAKDTKEKVKNTVATTDNTRAALTKDNVQIESLEDFLRRNEARAVEGDFRTPLERMTDKAEPIKETTKSTNLLTRAFGGLVTAVGGIGAAFGILIVTLTAVTVGLVSLYKNVQALRVVLGSTFETLSALAYRFTDWIGITDSFVRSTERAVEAQRKFNILLAAENDLLKNRIGLDRARGDISDVAELDKLVEATKERIANEDILFVKETRNATARLRRLNKELKDNEEVVKVLKEQGASIDIINEAQATREATIADIKEIESELVVLGDKRVQLLREEADLHEEIRVKLLDIRDAERERTSELLEDRLEAESQLNILIVGSLDKRIQLTNQLANLEAASIKDKLANINLEEAERIRLNNRLLDIERDRLSTINMLRREAAKAEFDATNLLLDASSNRNLGIYRRQLAKTGSIELKRVIGEAIIQQEQSDARRGLLKELVGLDPELLGDTQDTANKVLKLTEKIEELKLELEAVNNTGVTKTISTMVDDFDKLNEELAKLGEGPVNSMEEFINLQDEASKKAKSLGEALANSIKTVNPTIVALSIAIKDVNKELGSNFRVGRFTQQNVEELKKELELAEIAAKAPLVRLSTEIKAKEAEVNRLFKGSEDILKENFEAVKGMTTKKVAERVSLPQKASVKAFYELVLLQREFKYNSELVDTRLSKISTSLNAIDNIKWGLSGTVEVNEELNTQIDLLNKIKDLRLEQKTVTEQLDDEEASIELKARLQKDLKDTENAIKLLTDNLLEGISKTKLPKAIKDRFVTQLTTIVEEGNEAITQLDTTKIVSILKAGIAEIEVALEELATKGRMSLDYLLSEEGIGQGYTQMVVDLVRQGALNMEELRLRGIKNPLLTVTKEEVDLAKERLKVNREEVKLLEESIQKTNEALRDITISQDQKDAYLVTLSLGQKRLELLEGMGVALERDLKALQDRQVGIFKTSRKAYKELVKDLIGETNRWEKAELSRLTNQEKLEADLLAAQKLLVEQQLKNIEVTEKLGEVTKDDDETAIGLKKEYIKLLNDEFGLRVKFKDLIREVNREAEAERSALETSIANPKLSEFVDSISTVGSSLGDLFDSFSTFLVDKLETDLDRITNMLDAIDERVSDSQSRIDELNSELESARGARRKEILVDLDIERVKVAQLAMERDKATKDQVEAQERLDKAAERSQKIQAVTNTLNQAGLAISAIQSVFADPTTPSILLKLAAVTATIAAVTSGVNAIRTFEDGGVLDGPSHAQGGIRGTGRFSNIEVEGGEYVVNKKSTAKHLPLLEAINNDKFANGGVIPEVNSNAALLKALQDSQLAMLQLSNRPVQVAVTDINDESNRLVEVKSLSTL